MATSINLATPDGQIEWYKSIQKEHTTRASWMSKYGPEEYRLPPRLVKVKKPSPASEAPPAAAEPPAAADDEDEVDESYDAVLRKMRFTTTTKETFYDMHGTALHTMAKGSILAGQFNRRKSLQQL